MTNYNYLQKVMLKNSELYIPSQLLLTENEEQALRHTAKKCNTEIVYLTSTKIRVTKEL